MGRAGGRPGGPPRVGGGGRMGGLGGPGFGPGMPPPPPPRRGGYYRRRRPYYGGGCLTYMLGMMGVIALMVAGIATLIF